MKVIKVACSSATWPLSSRMAVGFEADLALSASELACRVVPGSRSCRHCSLTTKIIVATGNVEHVL